MVDSKFEIKNACSAGPETRGTITQSQDQEDMLSEGLVSAILWDLYDPANSQEPYDTISNSPGVFKVFDGLSESYLDIINPRNAKGVDIVDFLDIYCKNNTGRGNTKQGVEGILGHHKFPYDFKETCEK